MFLGWSRKYVHKCCRETSAFANLHEPKTLTVADYLWPGNQTMQFRLIQLFDLVALHWTLVELEIEFKLHNQHTLIDC